MPFLSTTTQKLAEVHAGGAATSTVSFSSDSSDDIGSIKHLVGLYPDDWSLASAFLLRNQPGMDREWTDLTSETFHEHSRRLEWGMGCIFTSLLAEWSRHDQTLPAKERAVRTICESIPLTWKLERLMELVQKNHWRKRCAAYS